MSGGLPLALHKNYFELFDLPPTFDIDLSDLSRRYRILMGRVHPDRVVNGSEQERRMAMQMASLLNDALQTLKNPTARARYLLLLRGVELNEETDTVMDPAFLSEQMELRERFEAARRDSNAAVQLAQEIERKVQRATETLRGYFSNHAVDIEAARQRVREMQFLDRLRRQVAEVEDDPA